MHAARLRTPGTSALLAALAAAFLAFPAESAAGTRVLAADALESAVVARVNTVRASRGLRRLTIRPRLETAAASHVSNMARYGYFAHSWSTGAAFGTWIRRHWPGPGYSSWAAGENLYWHSLGTKATEVVDAWMASPPHRANLLTPGWRGIGVGAVVAVNPSGVYRGSASATIVAAEFGRRS